MRDVDLLAVSGWFWAFKHRVDDGIEGALSDADGKKEVIDSLLKGLAIEGGKLMDVSGNAIFISLANGRGFADSSEVREEIVLIDFLQTKAKKSIKESGA